MTAGQYGPLPAVREDRGRFAAQRDRRVLIYWPHGFGDWVHLGYVLPLLEPSNAYAVTRFGDDYVSLMENDPLVTPLLSGVRIPGDGAAEGTPHLGCTLRRCNGANVRLRLAGPLRESIPAFAPDLLLWTDYPETEGRTAYPFHTKARNLVRLLVRKERIASLDLARPLRSSLDFTVDATLQLRVDERLTQLAAPGRRLCLISRCGVTAARKNWDEAPAREFAGALYSRGWRILSMDGDDFGDGAASFRDLFAGIDEPFGRLMKAVAARLDLVAGIPAGPLHFMLARGGVPAIGLWLAHHPDWYDEPNPDAIHLVGQYVRERGFDRRIATTSKPPALRHRIVYLDAPEIGAENVLEAAALIA